VSTRFSLQIDPLHARCWSLTCLVLPRGCASGVLLSRRLYLPSGIFIQCRTGIILVKLYNVNYLLSGVRELFRSLSFPLSLCNPPTFFWYCWPPCFPTFNHFWIQVAVSEAKRHGTTVARQQPKASTWLVAKQWGGGSGVVEVVVVGSSKGRAPWSWRFRIPFFLTRRRLSFEFRDARSQFSATGAPSPPPPPPRHHARVPGGGGGLTLNLTLR
jgi:hypothetical protein